MANPGDATVFIVDDDASVRRGLSRLIRSAGLAAKAFATAAEFLERPRPPGPSCLVLDVQLPGLSGLDLQEAMVDAGVDVPIVFITGHGDIPMSVEAMKKGAVDFLPKPFEDDDLLRAIDQAIERDRRRQREQEERGEIEQRVRSLTPRERQVFELVTTGLLNKQIGGKLGTSEKTVKVHRARVMQKMKAGSLADLVRIAEKVGLTSDR